MLKSAVSTLLLSSLGLAALGHSQQLTSPEVSAWKAIQPRVGYIKSGGLQVGVAVLVNSQGYFLTHRSSYNGNGGFVFLDVNGHGVQANFIASDDVTQLVLLKSEGWKPDPAIFTSQIYASKADAAPMNGSSLIAVLPTGPIRAVLTAGDKMGVLPSKRGVTLNEIRFEKPAGNFGGGMVFDLSGKLIGVLGATLDVQQTPNNMAKSTSGFSSEVHSSARAGATGGAGIGAPIVSFGPAQMTVAYSISSDLLARVIDGFLSPSRKPNLPVVGIFCSDAPKGGAEITNLTPGSAAEAAGLKVGDIITKMGDTQIGIASDFMRFVLRQDVGATIVVEVRRGDEVRTIEIKVGSGERF